MADSFNRLRHYAVVCGDDQNNYIGYLCAARAHCGERFVTGGIDKGYALIPYLNGICADVLGYSARFACGDLRFADIVQKRSFAVVYVTHNRYDGCAGY